MDGRDNSDFVPANVGDGFDGAAATLQQLLKLLKANDDDDDYEVVHGLSACAPEEQRHLAAVDHGAVSDSYADVCAAPEKQSVPPLHLDSVHRPHAYTSDFSLGAPPLKVECSLATSDSTDHSHGSTRTNGDSMATPGPSHSLSDSGFTEPWSAASLPHSHQQQEVRELNRCVSQREEELSLCLRHTSAELGQTRKLLRQRDDELARLRTELALAMDRLHWTTIQLQDREKELAAQQAIQ